MGVEPRVGDRDDPGHDPHDPHAPHDPHGSDDGASSARRLSASSRHAQLSRPDPGVPGGPRPGTAAAMAVAGGMLLAAATAGAWIRETVVSDAGAQAEVVAETLGWRMTGGSVLGVLGLLLACTGPLWLGAAARLRQVLIGGSALVAAAALLLLVRVQAVLDAGAVSAVESADVAARHVGVGWGVWATATGAAACALAAVTAWAAATTSTEDEA